MRPFLTLFIACCLGFIEIQAQTNSTIDLRNFEENIRLTAPERPMLLGADVAVGDVNGDGFDDLIAGAYSAFTGERIQVGRVYVMFGSASPRPALDLQNRAAGKTIIYGDDEYDLTGTSVASGDVNGDGFDDVIIGAHQLWHPIGKGIVFIVYGRSDWPDVVDLDSDGKAVDGVTRINGRNPDDQLGSTLASGDVNGDGLADVVLGAISAGPSGNGGPEGEVYLLYGSRSLPNVGVATVDSLAMTTIHGTRAGNIGEYSACLDLNGDAHAEILLGDVVFNKAAGRVFVIYGQPNLPADIDLAQLPVPELQITQILGEHSLDYLGWCFGSGDMDGDGLDELLIGSWQRVNQGEIGAGKGHIIWGTPGILPPIVELKNYRSKVTFLGDEMSDSFGFGFSCLDFNGDSFSDAVFSAPWARVDGKWSGKVFIIYGGSDFARHLGSTSTSARFERTQILGSREDQFLGNALASGDLNGDRIDDLVIGASDTETRAGSMAGEVYAIFGKRAGANVNVRGDGIVQNYPNPFNTLTIISYELSRAQHVTLRIHNLMGKEVRTLVDGLIQAGENSAIWDGLDGQFRAVSSGVYFCRISTETQTATIKLLLLK